MSVEVVYKEDEMSRKLDRCMTDGALKLGGGVILGTVFSLLFFKRKKWPILLGAGFGTGMAYSNFEYEMNATSAECERAKKKAVPECAPKKK